MRLFVHRLRLRVKDLDLADLASSSETMKKILTKKKLSSSDADKVVAQTLVAAADHQLEGLRRERVAPSICIRGRPWP
jgi:hypothetical protein